jgi:hypothetical protein
MLTNEDLNDRRREVVEAIQAALPVLYSYLADLPQESMAQTGSFEADTFALANVMANYASVLQSQIRR